VVSRSEAHQRVVRGPVPGHGPRTTDDDVAAAPARPPRGQPLRHQQEPRARRLIRRSARSSRSACETFSTGCGPPLISVAPSPA